MAEAPERFADKYKATKANIVNDFYEEIQLLKYKFCDSEQALEALDEIGDIVIWWANTPTLRKD